MQKEYHKHSIIFMPSMHCIFIVTKKLTHLAIEHPISKLLWTNRRTNFLTKWANLMDLTAIVMLILPISIESLYAVSAQVSEKIFIWLKIYWSISDGIKVNVKITGMTKNKKHQKDPSLFLRFWFSTILTIINSSPPPS